MIIHAINSTTKNCVEKFDEQEFYVGQELLFRLLIINIAGEIIKDIALQIDLAFEILAAIKATVDEDIYGLVNTSTVDSLSSTKVLQKYCKIGVYSSLGESADTYSVDVHNASC